MSGFPPFAPGDRRIAPQWLNDLDRKRREAEVGRTAGTSNGDTRITVLLVRKPVEAHTTLRVRRVRYNTPRPQECNEEVCHYEFATDEFDAYPDFGQSIMDYEDDDWEGPGISDEDTFLKAYKEDGSWRIEKPPTATAEIDYCVILQTSTSPNPSGVSPTGDATLGAFRLRVQRIHLNDQGVYVAKGSPIVASTRPNAPGTLYDDYRRSNRNGSHSGSPTSENWSWSFHANMVTFSVTKSDGVWICEQPPPLVTRPFPSGTAAGCTTVA